ncbi:MAG: S41 family peptidase, partial [Thermotaleaceae bacterium]
TEGYKAAKARFLKETNRDMTVKEFRSLASMYLSSIQDGHTVLYWGERKYLEVDWTSIDGKLVLLDEDKQVTDKVVAKINGVAIEQVLDTIKELFPAENEVAESENYAIYSKVETVLINAGIDCSNAMKLTIISEAGKEEIKTEFVYAEKERIIDYEISNKKLDDKTIYVKFGVCQMNEDLNKVAESLKKAVDEGIEKVIIDVRNNPGGDSRACVLLLEALQIKPGHFGAVIRFSPLAQQTYGYLRKSGYITYEGSNDVIKNENIDLYVIINEQTFSSAQWLATWVKDGNLGTIVGRPSSNMPSSFGDVLQFQLPNSKLEGQISYKKWTRPDKTRDRERMLEPDIYVNYSQDPLDVIAESGRSK